MDIVVWLRSLGLGKYEGAFRENDIDETVLPSLTHENLKELGVTSLGHRVKLLDAIAALRSDASGKTASVDAATTSSAPSAHPEGAERRQVTVMNLRNGHASGHVRDTACEAIETWLAWDGKGAEPSVEHEINYKPRAIPLSRALRLVYQCTDIVPGHLFDSLQCELSEWGPKRQTYAACARAILEHMKRRQTQAA